MLKGKIIVGLIVVIIILVSVAVVASGGIGGKKVTVDGTVYYDMITGWGVTCDGTSVSEGGLLSVPLWYMPWETMDIHVVVEIVGDKTYEADKWIGTISNIAGSKGFSIDVRHISSGMYSGSIIIYECEKGWFGLTEESRVERATTSFEVEVI